MVYQPGSLYLKARQQAVSNPAFRQSLHYRLTEEGVEVSQQDTKEFQSWDAMVKAVSTGRSIILYTSRTTASIFPNRELGEKRDGVVKMIATHMPPKKVNIRS